MITSIFCVALAYFCYFVLVTRGITFQSVDTDNEKQAKAAASWRQWKWPSDMHRYGFGKTAMKDGMIILLSGFQLLFKDTKTDRPLISLCLACNAVSTILIFFITRQVFDANIAILLSISFLSCLWITQVALFGGHICVGQMFFLAAIWACLQVDHSNLLSAGWFVLSGIFFITSQFSSASSRKYIPMMIACFFYSLRAVISGPVWIVGIDYEYLADLTRPQNIALFLLIGGLFLYGSARASVLRTFLKRSFSPSEQILTIGVIYLFVSSFMSVSAFYYIAHLAFIAGIALSLTFFLAPDLKTNLSRYCAYGSLPKTTCRFKLYLDFFKRHGHPIPEDFVGEGWRWLLRISLRFAPFHFFLACLSIFFILAIALLNPASHYSFLGAVTIALIAISPAAWGELTNCPQISRSYLPMLLGFIFLIGCGLFQTSSNPTAYTSMIFLSVGGLIAMLLHSLYSLNGDIIPARMASTIASRKLKALGATKFFTYKSVYNEGFVDCPGSNLNVDFEISYISSLSEVRDGIILVPCISSKAFHLESMPWAMEFGDLDQDHKLSLLVDSGRIEDLAIAKIKTFGSSSYWGYESEVVSYRDNVLKEISVRDKRRGYAWILDGSKVAAFFDEKHTKWGASSSMGSKVGIVIPTMNRADFVERTVGYFENVRFKGALYICDSSADESFNKTKQLIESASKSCEVHHIDCRGLNFTDSFNSGLLKVDRPYVAYLGDDDFFIPSGLDQCANFLDHNSDFSAAHGEGIAFTLERSGPYGKIESIVHYPEPNLEYEMPIQRLTAHCCSYLVTIFSVHRTETFHAMTRNLSVMNDRMFRDELGACCLSTIFGKVKALDSLCLVRQAHDRRYVCPTQFSWVSNPNWGQSYPHFVHILAREIALISQVDIKTIREHVERAISFYIARSLASEALGMSIALATDIPAKPWKPTMFLDKDARFTSEFKPVLDALESRI